MKPHVKSIYKGVYRNNTYGITVRRITAGQPGSGEWNIEIDEDKPYVFAGPYSYPFSSLCASKILSGFDSLKQIMAMDFSMHIHEAVALDFDDSAPKCYVLKDTLGNDFPEEGDLLLEADYLPAEFLGKDGGLLKAEADRRTARFLEYEAKLFGQL